MSVQKFACLILYERGEERVWKHCNNTFHADGMTEELSKDGFVEVMRFIADIVEVTRVVKFKFREQK